MPFRSVPLVAVLLALSACANDRAVPAVQDTTTGAIDTGTFPNLNIKPRTAAQPLSATDKAAMVGTIGAARAGQAAAGASGAQASPELLKKLAAQHGDEALKEIEGQ